MLATSINDKNVIFCQGCDKLRWIVDALRQYEASKPRFLLSGCMARKLLNVQRFRCLIFLFLRSSL
ncbi:hypothetical protein MIZ03_4182 [Rhodoferax lithotrophicus]|uniref:Uncharacterized protein n=1 Tax=Rhodoferax lithotrophicus TaxID=2798804 RepID=A0ABM7MSN8_9BURK|nr:hypothetical protein MIZ03_4182 [Rhodoferax sp. MIZ03]